MRNADQALTYDFVPAPLMVIRVGVRITILVAILVVIVLVLIAAPPAYANPVNPAVNPAAIADSIRREAGRMAAAGRMEQALNLVERHSGEMPAVWKAMFAGKLELEGETAARGYAGAAADTAPEQMRGEAIFRLGQYHYAAGRYHLAIPQFRLYLARYPNGVWSQESGYWMAHACLQFVRQRPDRRSYLDTALVYLRAVERKGRDAYYWPLARTAQARVHLLRGDTMQAVLALRDARAEAPAEEMPGVLLLSLQTEPSAAAATAWEDSLRWNYPLSPEARLLPRPVTVPRAVPPSPPAAAERALPPPSSGHALQLGAFSLKENAERFRGELAAKKINARVEPLVTPERTLYRVLSGKYPDAETALREGRRQLTPLGYTFRVVDVQ